MSTLSLRLPNSLHDRVRRLAEAEDISVNQFTSTAVAEKYSALMTSDSLDERGNAGSREAFDAVLAKVPDVQPFDVNDVL